jgi:Tfp pilus assembly protein FimT
MLIVARRSRRRSARGVTLMELVLVLALVILASSLTMPAVLDAFSGVRLRRAGDAVLSRWAQARAQAIETGIVYQFRFTPDTGIYRLEPWTSTELSAAPGATPRNSSGSNAASSTSAAPASTASSTTTEPTADKTLAESPTIESQLPEPIKFQGGQTAVDDRVRGERRVNALQTSGESWSTPVLFFPDGSSSTATIVLQDDAPRYMRLTLRGLTGVARASGIMTRAELDDSSRTQ